jgi:hypothetical protein
VRAQQAALELWGIEVHRLGGIRAARMLDILERNVGTWRKGLLQDWTLLDIADGSERAIVIVRELKEKRRKERREEGLAALRSAAPEGGEGDEAGLAPTDATGPGGAG